MDGVTVLAGAWIVSFAVDRTTTGILFLLSFSKAWMRKFPEPNPEESAQAQEGAQKRQKLVYFVIAAALAIPLLAGFGRIRVLSAMGFQCNYILDTIVTGLMLVGASDRISEMLKTTSPQGEKKESKPIAITGTLVLEDGALKARAASSPG